MTTISKLKKSFATWRRGHDGTLRGLPIELQSQAVQLLDSYSWKEVSKQLRVSTATLHRWRKSTGDITQPAPVVVDEDLSICPRDSSNASQFVEVECIVDAPETKGAPLTVTLEMPDGVSLRVDGPMDGNFVQGLVQVVCQRRAR